MRGRRGEWGADLDIIDFSRLWPENALTGKGKPGHAGDSRGPMGKQSLGRSNKTKIVS